MFTGLVQHVGTLKRVAREGPEARLTVAAPFEGLELGESVAVMGACLTVTHVGEGEFSAFASAETLVRTGLGDMPAGSEVNLERALRLADRLGGHLVSGHVDARVALRSRRRVAEAERLTVELPREPLASQIAPKGSVALDGVSLTVNEVDATSFEVMVIPLTLEQTTLGRASPGDRLNLETDVLAKYVARQLRGEGAGGDVSLDLLERAGFVR
jgi:riboflavin synthase